MEPNEREQQLADYLAGDMTPRGRAEFEAVMAGDKALASLAADLRKTQGLIASVALPAWPAARTAPIPMARRWAMPLAAAAAVALAFVGGFTARGLTFPQRPTDQHVLVTEQAQVVKAWEASPNPELAQNLFALAVLARRQEGK